MNVLVVFVIVIVVCFYLCSNRVEGFWNAPSCDYPSSMFQLPQTCYDCPNSTYAPMNKYGYFDRTWYQ